MSDGTHSYFDWQLSTLMLAYDVVEPLPRSDERRITLRQQAVEKELHALADATIPRQYQDNPSVDFPPQIVSMLTRATLERAAAILAQTP